jgi:hypothetical protein
MVATASIVLFNTPASEVRRLVAELQAQSALSTIVLVDHSPSDSTALYSDLGSNVKYVWPGRNRGFGAGHNLAVSVLDTPSDWHFVVNPDVEVGPDVIAQLVARGSTCGSIGAVAPKVLNVDGSIQRVARLLPGPLDVFGRRFFPRSGWTSRRDESYELVRYDYSYELDAPFLSGCFVGYRTDLFRTLRGFDESFFLYAEDLDLCRRIGDSARTLVIPDVSVTHRWARESHRRSRMTAIAIASFVRYFNKWGWIRDRAREARNLRTLRAISRHQQRARALQ